MPRLPTGNTILNTLFLHADLAGRPHRVPDFREALRAVVNLNDITGVGQYRMSHFWMVTYVNTATKEKLAVLEELRVKIENVSSSISRPGR